MVLTNQVKELNEEKSQLLNRLHKLEVINILKFRMMMGIVRMIRIMRRGRGLEGRLMRSKGFINVLLRAVRNRMGLRGH